MRAPHGCARAVRRFGVIVLNIGCPFCDRDGLADRQRAALAQPMNEAFDEEQGGLALGVRQGGWVGGVVVIEGHESAFVTGEGIPALRR